MISTYEAAKRYMSKARNASTGRAMKSSNWRMYQDGNEYVVYAYKVMVGRFLPDNTFMFTLDGSKAHRIAQTLSITIDRNLPFGWQRCGKQTYRVDHRDNIDGRLHTSAPQVYDGLRFDLFTGKCLNYKSDLTQRVNPDRRKEWLAACKAWKRKLRVAARLGAFDALIREELADRTSWTARVQWNSKQGIDTLYKVIKDNDCSVEVMRMFVASSTGRFGWPAQTSQEIYACMDKIVTANSVELRKRFGVFEGE